MCWQRRPMAGGTCVAESRARSTGYLLKQTPRAELLGAVEKLDVQTASSRPATMTKRYWAVGGTRRAKRSQVRLVEA